MVKLEGNKYWPACPEYFSQTRERFELDKQMNFLSLAVTTCSKCNQSSVDKISIISISIYYISIIYMLKIVEPIVALTWNLLLWWNQLLQSQSLRPVGLVMWHIFQKCLTRLGQMQHWQRGFSIVTRCPSMMWRTTWPSRVFRCVLCDAEDVFLVWYLPFQKSCSGMRLST